MGAESSAAMYTSPMSNAGDKTSFGDREVSADEKARLVGDVFDAVAHRYDLMNDLMSLGSHRLLKRLLVEMAGVREHYRVLDLAGGTGDLTRLIAPSVGPTGAMILADSNATMLCEGRDRLLDGGIGGVRCCRAAAETLPFPADYFDRVVIGFGLRNFTDKQTALGEIRRVLKPGGVLLVLEFSKPANPVLEGLSATWQSFWPAMGQLVVGEGGSYRYLVESIRVHPGQEALKLMMEDARFGEVEFHNLLGGIAAIHRGVA